MNIETFFCKTRYDRYIEYRELRSLYEQFISSTTLLASYPKLVPQFWQPEQDYLAARSADSRYVGVDN